MMKQTLGVLGGNSIGVALADSLEKRGYPVVLIEPTGELSIPLETIKFVFLCVDSSQFWSVVEETVSFLTKDTCLIIHPTVPIGTGDQLQDWCDQKGLKVVVASCAMMEIQHPSHIVIGGQANHPKLKELRHIMLSYDVPILMTTRKEAEIIQYTRNAFLATKMSFINQVASFCETFGGDIQTIARGIGMDPRIGQGALKAGIGFGESLSDNLLSLIEQGKQNGVKTPLLEAVQEINDVQGDWVKNRLRRELGALEGKTIAIWGVRDQPALDIIEQLLAEGMELHLYDPFLSSDHSFPRNTIWHADKWKTVEQAEALIILQECQPFQEVDLLHLKEKLNHPLILDGRNLFYPDMMDMLGFRYIPVGRKV
ncbi:UDP binding domain-containing protein [Ammoniphilus sp. CFH 90114]|uniref:UDP binding domain-containing protein n=1 Tax=Ammoniphilus sp. CFH 90114 TaxID=2493665 RepID=UPI00100DD0C7|nr:UDP binding domain-containing protein [Ammoniphilus sp. CFH 90114]RXT08980.1 UDP-glucose/GDP-mannose dehydrogenase family protein [Ammoniphilus sp. CFH 90114]